MAKDAIRNLAKGAQCCLYHLNNLVNHIKSQATPAAKAAADEQNPEIPSLHNNDSAGFQTRKDDVAMPSASESMLNHALQKYPPEIATEPSTLAAAKRQKRPREVIEITEGAPPEKRSRNMTDGYYDKREQSMLRDLMSSVSEMRRSMRNTKLEIEIARTKVAWIKRPAEADVLDGKIDNKENDLEELLSLRHMRTSKRRFSALYPTPPPSPESEGAEDPSLDLYGWIENNLEIVESLGEKGADKFLREGHCNNELREMQKRLIEVLKILTEEVECVQLEEPEPVEAMRKLWEARSHHPISMCRNVYPVRNDATIVSVKVDTEKFEAAKPEGRSTPRIYAEAPPGIIEADPNYAPSEFILLDLVYRSTRHMTPGNPNGWVVAVPTF